MKAHAQSRDSSRGMVIVVVVLAAAILIFAIIALAMLLRDMSRQMDAVQTVGVTPADTGGSFTRAWSIAVSPPLIHEMALAPGRPGEFLALNANRLQRFDASGTRRQQFDAPRKSSRIATDGTGAIPYVVITSSATKWTGAIDHTVTTDYFLQALDLEGGEVWKKRFDPKEISAPEPSIVTLDAGPAIILSASRRILAFTRDGTELWNMSLWHHPGTVTPADLQGRGPGLLAAAAPKREILQIGSDGSVIGSWGIGDGPSRLRALGKRDNHAAVSVRQVFGRGQGGPRFAVAFFAADGSIVSEVDLPKDRHQISYSPVISMDTDGSGRRNWIIPLDDGTILVFSPLGEELARLSTGERIRSVLALPQHGPDLLVTSTHRGLTAWRPVPARIQRPR
jgi:hypothetical protein